MVLGTRSGEGLNPPILLVASYVTVPVAPAIKKVFALMLAGSMDWLNTTAISRLVPTPLLCGTTINTVGTSEEAGCLAIVPQLMRKTAIRKGVKILES